MNRRDLFFLLNGATISGSLPTGAQQKTTPAVVVVSEEEVARLIAQRHSIVDDILDERTVAGRCSRCGQCPVARPGPRHRGLMHSGDQSLGPAEVLRPPERTDEGIE
jgi:hypothetical protein